jgi:hypothetical protein
MRSGAAIAASPPRTRRQALTIGGASDVSLEREQHMKRRKAKPVRAPFTPAETDVFEAIQALQSGDERPVRQCLGDLAQILNFLANRSAQLVPQDRPPVLLTEHVVVPDEDAEWEGSFLQVKEAIEHGDMGAVGLYLRDAAKFLRRLAGLPDGQTPSGDWQWTLRRRERGRRSDPVSRMLRDSLRAMELRFATLHAGKQESALADLKARRGISRATMMRAKRRSRAKSLTKSG